MQPDHDTRAEESRFAEHERATALTKDRARPLRKALRDLRELGAASDLLGNVTGEHVLRASILTDQLYTALEPIYPGWTQEALTASHEPIPANTLLLLCDGVLWEVVQDRTIPAPVAECKSGLSTPYLRGVLNLDAPEVAEDLPVSIEWQDDSFRLVVGEVASAWSGYQAIPVLLDPGTGRIFAATSEYWLGSLPRLFELRPCRTVETVSTFEPLTDTAADRQYHQLQARYRSA